MIEGSGSIPLTNLSGSRCPKKLWIRNTDLKIYLANCSVLWHVSWETSRLEMTSDICSWIGIAEFHFWGWLKDGGGILCTSYKRNLYVTRNFVKWCHKIWNGLCLQLYDSKFYIQLFCDFWSLKADVSTLYIYSIYLYIYSQCCGSGMFIPDPRSDFFPSRIPDPNCLHPGSRILIKEFKYFNPQKQQKNGF